MDNTIDVKIADMKTARNTQKLKIYALGSCIGVALYEPNLKVAALIHVMLPEVMNGKLDNVFKYADTSIPHTLQLLERMGANRRNIIAKIAGGSKMFDNNIDDMLSSIGARNADSVIKTLMRNGIRIIARDVGGSIARTMTFDVNTGTTYIKVVGKAEYTI